ncbi:glycosyltransferase [Herbaspirillum seropedicae]|uniref:glycosyltransferase n=1 Tax=Herbaspirillum seropedicae TaxID=964 RepID=UPI001FD3C6D0|nr:glycosyltransferase [Herbaspirillum seropedicae]
MPEIAPPLVCVCVPTYNSARTLRETLLSLTAQSYPNLKIKVVDNASDDDTAKVVAAVADNRIELHRHAVNVGAEENFSRCIALGEGKYTAIFHADDVYEPQMLEKQVAFLEANSVAGGVFTEAKMIDETGQPVGSIRQPADLAASGPLFDFKQLYKAILRHSNFLICPSFLARTDVYQREVISWRGELFGSSSDLDVWIRILRHHPCGILPEPLMRYRISASQGSASVRQGVGRADFFRVIDYYQAQEWVKQQLDRTDYLNYSRLERRDRVMRAVNSLILDDPVQARNLCNDVLSIDALHAALQSKRGLMVLLLGIFVRLSLALGLNGPAKHVLSFVKRKANK